MGGIDIPAFPLWDSRPVPQATQEPSICPPLPKVETGPPHCDFSSDSRTCKFPTPGVGEGHTRERIFGKRKAPGQSPIHYFVGSGSVTYTSCCPWDEPPQVPVTPMGPQSRGVSSLEVEPWHHYSQKVILHAPTHSFIHQFIHSFIHSPVAFL